MKIENCHQLSTLLQTLGASSSFYIKVGLYVPNFMHQSLIMIAIFRYIQNILYFS